MLNIKKEIMIHSFKKITPKIIRNLIRHIRRNWRKTKRKARLRYLQYKFPNGHISICNDAEIFVNYSDKNSYWYDGDSDSLKDELEYFVSLFNLRKPSVIIDVGAHWGFYPAFLDKYCNSAKANIEHLICIEPDPKNLFCLKNTVNRVQNFDVSIIEKAVSNTSNVVNFYREGGQDCGHIQHTQNSKYACKVDAATLSEIISKIDMSDKQVTHIKVDIDGYEPAFFEGAADVLKKYNPLMLIEFYAKGIESAGYDLGKYWNFLITNYNVYEIGHEKKVGMLELFHDDLPYLQEKTMDIPGKGHITNLILLPRGKYVV